jgi:uncharacterized membrane protein YkgB
MKLTDINTQQIGNLISKAGLVLVLLWIGIYKFTPSEAKLIEPLLVNSPLFSWQLAIFPLETLSKIIGVIEIIVALLILLEFKFKKLAQVGYLVAVIMFLSTLSFLFTTPDTFKVSDGILITNWFILKDIIFLGFCVSKLDLKLLLNKD